MPKHIFNGIESPFSIGDEVAAHINFGENSRMKDRGYVFGEITNVHITVTLDDDNKDYYSFEYTLRASNGSTHVEIPLLSIMPIDDFIATQKEYLLQNRESAEEIRKWNIASRNR